MTDNGSYNKLAVDNLKIIYTDVNVSHITCVIHMISRVLSILPGLFVNALKFYKKLSAILKNSVKARNSFKSIVGLCPPKIVEVRWGSLVKTINFLHNHISKISTFANYMKQQPKSTKTKSIEEFFECVNNQNCLEELKMISSLSFVVNEIVFLQKKNLTCVEQVDSVRRVKIKLNKLLVENPKSKFEPLVKKLDAVLFKNAGFLNCELQVSEGTLPNYHNNLPLTTSEVERTFSMLHRMINKLTTNLSNENVEKNMVIKHFYEE